MNTITIESQARPVVLSEGDITGWHVYRPIREDRRSHQWTYDLPDGVFVRYEHDGHLHVRDYMVVQNGRAEGFPSLRKARASFAGCRR